MGTLVATAAKGQTQFEANTWRNRDDASDNKTGSSYTHRNIEFSATEADEWVSWMLYVTQLLRSGSVAWPIRNTTGGTLARGTTVYVSGYNSANSAFTVTKADADNAYGAMLVITADLANNTNGTGYATATVTGTSGEHLDTSAASAVGDLVYQSATAGAFTFTAPTGVGQTVQIIGVVLVKDATNGSIAFYPGSRIMKLNAGTFSVQVYKSADQTRNSTTTFADDTDLKVTLPEAGKYRVNLVAYVVTSVTPGIKWGLNGPTKNNVMVIIDQKYNFTGRLDDWISGAAATWYPGGSPAEGYVTIDGTVDVSASGTLAFSWAQATSNAADTKVMKGSYLVVTRIS